MITIILLLYKQTKLTKHYYFLACLMYTQVLKLINNHVYS